MKLATTLFCSSTIDALNYYIQHEDEPWSQMFFFLSFIHKSWSVLNVKSSSKRFHKRDINSGPVRSRLDRILQFLSGSILRILEHQQRFWFIQRAMKQTCISIAECATYLLDRLGFSYILLGKLQLDSFERRFGWYRQMSTIYFISTRQVYWKAKETSALYPF